MAERVEMSMTGGAKPQLLLHLEDFTKESRPSRTVTAVSSMSLFRLPKMSISSEESFHKRHTIPFLSIFSMVLMFWAIDVSSSSGNGRPRCWKASRSAGTVVTGDVPKEVSGRSPAEKSHR